MSKINFNNLSKTLNINVGYKSASKSNKTAGAYAKYYYQRLSGNQSSLADKTQTPSRFWENSSRKIMTFKRSTDLVPETKKSYLMQKPARATTQLLTSTKRPSYPLQSSKAYMSSPMSKFYNQKRYKTSASSSSASIVSKRYVWKPYKNEKVVANEAEQKPSMKIDTQRANSTYATSRLANAFQNLSVNENRNETERPPVNLFKNDLMSFNKSIKNLISLGPRRAITYQPKSDKDPLSGWKHPSKIDINPVFKDHMQADEKKTFKWIPHVQAIPSQPILKKKLKERSKMEGMYFTKDTKRFAKVVDADPSESAPRFDKTPYVQQKQKYLLNRYNFGLNPETDDAVEKPVEETEVEHTKDSEELNEMKMIGDSSCAILAKALKTSNWIESPNLTSYERQQRMHSHYYHNAIPI